MTQARRAIGQRRRSKAVFIFTGVALVLVVLGILAIFGLRRQADLGNLPIPRPFSSAPASTAATDPTSTGPAQEDSAYTALKACRANVAAADRVLAAGKDGMRNWSDHIQAQTDANAGKITIAEMDAIFDRTMKAGDHDEDRYADAIQAHQDTSGSCEAVPGAPTEVANQLTRCAERRRAQDPVLSAVHDGMADWTKHLGEMRLSMKGKIHNPQKKWLQTWRAAPRNINAYKQAAGRFSAPDC
jgi:hypothetical protein